MNVVARGLMAAGMGVYGTIHAQQTFTGDGAAWQTVAFGLAALAAYGLMIALVLAPERLAARLELAALLLSVMSAVALTITLTMGMFGIEDELRVPNLMAYVAEAVVLLSYLALRQLPTSTDEQDDATATRIVEK